jgi:alpha-mannosidase
MKLDEVAILLSCHTFEDFPVFYRGKDADSLLASWTALWHPRLIANCGRMPTWHRADELPAHDRARLLVRPTTSGPRPGETLADDVVAAGGLLIDQLDCRAAIVQRALDAIGGPEPVDAELAADFMSLGYAYLQTELLTRKMRYATRVAETAFADNLVSAARAADAGDSGSAQSLLQSCFDLLSQERNHYYAVDVFLLDLSLVVETLLAGPLQRQLSCPNKSNLLLEPRLLEQLQQHEPTSWAALQAAVAERRAGLIGGEFAEQPLSLMSTDTIRRQLEQGLREFEQRLGQRPVVYGRRRFGLTPALPQMLVRMDFTGALHATFDGGRFPEATQAKSRWEGDGQFSIDAITRPPLDATQSETFLNLATTLSESMDIDHIATRCFVHWAGDISPWYQELQRVARFTPSLGRFVTVDEYFQETYDSGIHDRFTADQYRSPWLAQQCAARDARPISACIDYWRHFLRLQSWHNCSALWLLVRDCADSRDHLARAQAYLDHFSRRPLDAGWNEDEYATRRELDAAAAGLARAVVGQGVTTTDQDPSGYVLVNPCSFPRRIGLSDSRVLPRIEPPVYAAEATDDGVRVVADVPALGLSRVSPSGSTRSTSPRSGPPLAAENMLRNDFLEAHVDPRTGGLVTLRDYRDRTNRLSQQLACRTPGDTASGRTQPATYSRMVADSVQLLQGTSVVGKIQSRGRLVNQSGATLVEFSQTFQIWRGSRVLEIGIELQPYIASDNDPWESYIACRFAWNNEGAELARSLNDVRQVTQAKRFEAPLFIQIDTGGATTTVITGGIPFHRRINPRMLDTILITGQEQQRQFRIGLGVDLKQPFRDAIAFVAPELIVPMNVPQDRPQSTWLFHVDARHVLCTIWQPVWQDDRVAGVRARLIEMEGRSGRVKLRSFRPLSSARKIDGRGQTVEVCDVDGEQMMISVSPMEQVEIEAMFA